MTPMMTAAPMTSIDAARQNEVLHTRTLRLPEGPDANEVVALSLAAFSAALCAADILSPLVASRRGLGWYFSVAAGRACPIASFCSPSGDPDEALSAVEAVRPMADFRHERGRAG